MAIFLKFNRNINYVKSINFGKKLNFSILSTKIIKSRRMFQNPCQNCKCRSSNSPLNCYNRDFSTSNNLPVEFNSKFVEVFPKSSQNGSESLVKFKRLDDLSNLLRVTESNLLKSDGTNVKFLNVPPEVLTGLTSLAFSEIMHFLRTEHLAQLRKVFDDPESSDNDRFVSMQLLKNACISAGKY